MLKVIFFLDNRLITNIWGRYSPKEVPNVTVLSTVKNIELTASPFIKSLVNQTYRDYQILIIDACSSDDTRLILADELSKGSIPYEIIELDSNQPKALNFPISQSLLNTEYVAFIDGDCVADADWLSNLVSCMEETNSDAVGGPGFTPPGASMLQKLIGLDLDTRFKSTPEGPINRHPNMNLLVRRDVLENVPFDETMDVAYDTDFGYRATSIGYRFYYTPDAVVMHHHRPNLKSYCKQQIKSAEFSYGLYLRGGASRKGDNINPWWMLLQLPIFTLILLTSPLVFHHILYIIPLMFGVTLAVLFIQGTLVSAKATKQRLSIALPFLYSLRICLWVMGLWNAVTRQARSKSVTKASG
jgi:glycosyltransferase involved in cell wall biosynthesis